MRSPAFPHEPDLGVLDVADGQLVRTLSLIGRAIVVARQQVRDLSTAVDDVERVLAVLRREARVIRERMTTADAKGGDV